jgi:hypothetical protein
MPTLNQFRVTSGNGVITYAEATPVTTTTNTGLATPVATVAASAPTATIIPHNIYGNIASFSANQILFQVLFVNAIAFPLDFAGSLAICTTAPTYDAVFAISYNGNTVGDLVFAAGALTGVFTLGAAITTVPGDLLSMLAPNPVDPTLADLVYTLSGTVVQESASTPQAI